MRNSKSNANWLRRIEWMMLMINWENEAGAGWLHDQTANNDWWLLMARYLANGSLESLLWLLTWAKRLHLEAALGALGAVVGDDRTHSAERNQPVHSNSLILVKSLWMCLIHSISHWKLQCDSTKYQHPFEFNNISSNQVDWIKRQTKKQETSHSSIAGGIFYWFNWKFFCFFF